MVRQSLAGFSDFAEFLGAGMAALVVYLVVYALITGINELRLVREGNVAAAVSLAGVTVAFCIPLAGVILNSRNLTDVVVWSSISLFIQLVVVFAVRRIIRGIEPAIESGNVADGLFLATIQMAVGIIIAASLTGAPTPAG